MLATWPRMAKKAKNGRNGPQRRSHISMIVDTNTLTKVAIDTWDLGPKICPMSTRQNPFYAFFPLAEKWYTKNGKIPHIGPPMALRSQREDIGGHTLFEAGLCPLSESPLTLDNGCTKPGGEH